MYARGVYMFCESQKKSRLEVCHCVRWRRRGFRFSFFLGQHIRPEVAGMLLVEIGKDEVEDVGVPVCGVTF